MTRQQVPPKSDPALEEAQAERLSVEERVTLAVLGLLALAALGCLAWQRRPVALVVSAVPSGVEGRPQSAPPSMASPAPTVTTAGLVPAPAAEWDVALEAARHVDVNAADAAELERLPGVGPVLAQRIVEEREQRGPFRSAEELSRVRGIGPKLYERLKDYVATE